MHYGRILRATGQSRTVDHRNTLCLPKYIYPVFAGVCDPLRTPKYRDFIKTGTRKGLQKVFWTKARGAAGCPINGSRVRGLGRRRHGALGHPKHMVSQLNLVRDDLLWQYAHLIRPNVSAHKTGYPNGINPVTG